MPAASRNTFSVRPLVASVKPLSGLNLGRFALTLPARFPIIGPWPIRCATFRRASMTGCSPLIGRMGCTEATTRRAPRISGSSYTSQRGWTDRVNIVTFIVTGKSKNHGVLMTKFDMGAAWDDTLLLLRSHRALIGAIAGWLASKIVSGYGWGVPPEEEKDERQPRTTETRRAPHRPVLLEPDPQSARSTQGGDVVDCVGAFGHGVVNREMLPRRPVALSRWELAEKPDRVLDEAAITRLERLG